MKQLKIEKKANAINKKAINSRDTTAGITLIALVITIITLLILSGISIWVINRK